jgi:hypothetical protein
MQAIAHKCLEGAESNSMTFPQVVSTLMEVGFEGYSVDLWRGSVKLRLSLPDTPIRDLSLKSLAPVAPAIWFHSLAGAFFILRAAPKLMSNIFLRQHS